MVSHTPGYRFPLLLLPQCLHISSLPNHGFTKAHLCQSTSVPEFESTTGPGKKAQMIFAGGQNHE